MDTQAVNSAGNPTVRPPKAQESSSSSGSKPVTNSVTKTTEDTITLSSKAQALAGRNNIGPTSSSSEQRKFLEQMITRLYFRSLTLRPRRWLNQFHLKNKCN